MHQADALMRSSVVGADPRRKAILRSQARNIRRSAQQHLKRQAQEQLVRTTRWIRSYHVPSSPYTPLIPSSPAHVQCSGHENSGRMHLE